MSKHLITAVIVSCTHPLAFAQQQMNPAATYHGHVDAARAVAFSPDGKLLASGSDDQTIILWDLAKGTPRAILEGHRTSIWNLAFSPDGKTLASGIGQPSSDRPSGWDFTIKLWDVETGRLRRSLVGSNSNVFSMAFSPDGKYLAACHNASNDNVKLWDVATGRLLGSPTRGGHGQSLAFSNDGKLLAVANRGTEVELWEPATGERKGTVRLSHEVTGGLRFSPDDQLLAVGTTKSVTLCDLATGKEIRKFEESNFFPTDILFTPDGKKLLAPDWHVVKMWDVQTGKVLAEFRSAPSGTVSGGVNGLAVSRNGTLIAAARLDFEVNVWRNPLSKSPVATIKSNPKDAIKAATEKPHATKTERDADFQWFSDLSYLDEKKNPFVKVYTSVFGLGFDFHFSFGTDKPTESSGEISPPAQQTVHGFLLEKRENQFTVLTPGLAKDTFKFEPGAKAKENIVRFEAADLKIYAAAVLKELRAPKKADRWSRDSGTDSALPVFVLAWACSRQGLDDLAAELHHHAAKMPTVGDQLAPRPLRDLLADELAAIAVRSALFDYGRPEMPRAQILRELDEKLKRFGESANHDDGRVLLLNLRKMVQEDAERLKIAKPLAQLSQQEQIDELIFQLRDQGGFSPQSNFVNRMKTFEDPIDHRVDHDPWPNAPKSPAQQLVKLGIAAASQLIDHLDDDRLTRSMATKFGSSQVASLHDVLRVGDCAVLILERMSGRKFNGENRLPLETKRRILAWYAEVQKKGEKQTLIDGVHRGDEESYEQAFQLIAKYESDAMPAILVGIKATKEHEIRSWLLRAAGRLKDCDPLLLAELKEGPLPASRLEAAKILHRRRRPEAVAGMIALWMSEVARKQADGDDNRQLLAEIAATMIATEQAAAIDQIAPQLRKCSVGLRQDVAESCWSSLAPRDGFFPGAKRIEPKAPADARLALERILFTLLDDTEENENSFPKLRTCDIAAAAFHDVSAKHYSFDAKASVQERDRAIREIRSVWVRLHPVSP